MHLKTDNSEFKNEMSKIKNKINLVSESGGGSGKNNLNSGLKVIIKQEVEKKVNLLKDSFHYDFRQT